MNLSRWMSDTVTYANISSVSGFGDPVFGSQSTIKARVEHKIQKVRTVDGETKESSHVFATETDLSLDSRVWLPGDSTASVAASRRIIAKAKATLPGGYTIYEFYL